MTSSPRQPVGPAWIPLLAVAPALAGALSGGLPGPWRALVVVVVALLVGLGLGVVLRRQRQVRDEHEYERERAVLDDLEPLGSRPDADR